MEYAASTMCAWASSCTELASHSAGSMASVSFAIGQQRQRAHREFLLPVAVLADFLAMAGAGSIEGRPETRSCTPATYCILGVGPASTMASRRRRPRLIYGVLCAGAARRGIGASAWT